MVDIAGRARVDPPPRRGWYPDPREVGEDAEPGYRWWDGTGWTAWLADSDYAPAPRGEVERAEPRAQSRPPRSARWLVAALALAVVLLGLTALSIYGRTLPAPVPEAAVPSSLGTPRRPPALWGTRDRTVVIGERVEMTVADACSPDAATEKVYGLLRHGWKADCQQRSDEKQPAQQLLGDLEPALVVRGDSAATAEQAYQAMQRGSSAKLPILWGPARIEPWPGVAGASRLSAELRYQGAAPGTVPEQITVVVLPWQHQELSGMAAWIALQPQNLPAEVGESLTASQRSIRLVG